MKTLAVLSQKGGTGKTTIAVHLAVEASRAGQTVALIDLDPQCSAAKWSDTRDDDTPIVISAHATRLPQVLHTAEQGGVDLAIIDTFSEHRPHIPQCCPSCQSRADSQQRCPFRSRSNRLNNPDRKNGGCPHAGRFQRRQGTEQYALQSKKSHRSVWCTHSTVCPR